MKNGYMRFACGGRLPEKCEIAAPVDDKMYHKRKDGKYRFCVWATEDSPKSPASQVKAGCLFGCPAKHKDSGRKVQRCFLKEPNPDMKMGYFVTCYAEHIK